MAEDKKTTFNEVPELYDQARNRYPDELFGELFRLTGCTAEAHVLEIGAGTGIATLPVAQRGCRITAIELGSEMARVARSKLAEFSRVEVQVGAFEAWEPPAGCQYDMVLIATAFHWLDPKVRVKKIASLLRPGGYVAIIRYHHVEGGDRSFFDRVQHCYERFKPEGAGKFRLPRIEEVRPETGELTACGLFGEPITASFVTEDTYSRQQYLDLLSTYSDHRMMEASDREQLFDCIGRIIDGQYGGRVNKCYLHQLVLARKY